VWNTPPAAEVVTRPGIITEMLVALIDEMAADESIVAFVGPFAKSIAAQFSPDV
jgi:hypothetical protein